MVLRERFRKMAQGNSIDEQAIRQLNHHLSVQVILERMLYTYTCENYEQMKKVNPVLANIVRKDIDTLHRNHSFYISKFTPILQPQLYDEYENLQAIIEEYINK